MTQSTVNYFYLLNFNQRILYRNKLLKRITKGGAQVVWIRGLRTTCCSQFDSNT